MKIFVPPLKCQGIKTKLVDWIREHVELNTNGRWIEPFTGSGVVGFNVRPARALFADINPHIVNFYNAVKRGYLTAGKARVFLAHEGALLSQRGEAHYYQIRERFNREGDPYDFLFLSRASFNGIMRFNKKGQYNVPFGHKPERFAQAYITKIANQINYVENALKQYDWVFVCADFRDVLPQAAVPDFIYCDPPYMGRHTDYFNTWSETEEQDLFNLLAETPARFILSTWHSNQFRANSALDKYQEKFHVLTKEHFYHVGASENNRNAMLEAIVLNYLPVERVQPMTNHSDREMVQLRLLEKQVVYHKGENGG